MNIGLRLATILTAVLIAAGCASTTGGRKPDKITTELLSTPKEGLFEKGKALIEKKKYDAGRKYLSFVFETYPNDPLGRQALLMVADSFFRQGGSTGYTEARFRYRDFLNRYPGAAERDYARYQFAVCYDREHEKPDRDQTSTREAIDQYRALLREFPNTGHSAAANARIHALVDLLAEHEFAVGYFYMRKGAPGAALARFASLEERFPEYGHRDKLFFYEGQVLGRLGRRDEANRYYSRLLEEYPGSEFVKKARGKGEKTAPPATASVDTGRKSE
ncbi:MAG: outer membrane protein assembly factor BamD [Acidobacteriota bacterium]